MYVGTWVKGVVLSQESFGCQKSFILAGAALIEGRFKTAVGSAMVNFGVEYAVPPKASARSDMHPLTDCAHRVRMG
jgi:hypothetical protein